jgi:hypothetical protein
MSEAGPAGRTGEGSRARLLFAGALALALAAALAGALILGGDDDRDFATAPERCVEEWNRDSEAVSLGRHQADAPPSGHGYVHVQVTTLDPDGGDELEAGDPDAACAMIFAAPALSSEAASAVLVRADEVWQPLSGLEPPLGRLAALQEQAQSAYNARLEADGTIAPL